MKTYSPRPQDIERRWYVVDADGAVLGRLATEVAQVLKGKHKPIYAPHADTGDHVIVVNAKGVRLTGGKENKKLAHRHSGYPGGLTSTKYSRLMAERPSWVVEKAVKGMLPKNRLGRAMVKKLAVYDGPEHPHEAQKPVALKLGELPKWDGLPVPAPKPEAKPKEKKAAPKRAAAKPPAKPAAKKPAAKKRTTAKPAVKKPAAKKPAAAKKTAAKKTTAKRTSTKKKD